MASIYTIFYLTEKGRSVTILFSFLSMSKHYKESAPTKRTPTSWISVISATTEPRTILVSPIFLRLTLIQHNVSTSTYLPWFCKCYNHTSVFHQTFHWIVQHVFASCYVIPTPTTANIWSITHWNCGSADTVSRLLYGKCMKMTHLLVI